MPQVALTHVGAYRETPGTEFLVGKQGVGKKIVGMFAVVHLKGALAQAYLDDNEGNRYSTDVILPDEEGAEKTIIVPYFIGLANEGLVMQVITGKARAYVVYGVV